MGTFNVGDQVRVIRIHICKHMNWEDPEIAKKRKQLEDLKRQVATLEKELNA